MSKIPTLDVRNAASLPSTSQQQGNLENLKNLSSRKLSSPAEIEKAAEGFEALLLHQMLKSMWSTIDTTGLLGEDSNQAEIYRDMFNQAISETIAEGRGIGVKSFLKDELSKYEAASKLKE